MKNKVLHSALVSIALLAGPAFAQQASPQQETALKCAQMRGEIAKLNAQLARVRSSQHESKVKQQCFQEMPSRCQTTCEEKGHGNRCPQMCSPEASLNKTTWRESCKEEAKELIANETRELEEHIGVKEEEKAALNCE